MNSLEEFPESIPELSIIIPMYNEEENIDSLFLRLLNVLEHLTSNYEIICVNDGSKDATLLQLIQHQKRNNKIKVIDFSRNFGKEVALTAGLEYARGRAVIPIDADLQDPPDLIPELVRKWREGYEVVYATRTVRHGETFFKRSTARAFYRLINVLSEVPIPENTGDFRLLDRCAVDALKTFPERVRFMKGLFSWIGFKQIGIPYERDPRFAGKSKWKYWSLWNFALDGIIQFSSGLLKMWSYVGIGVSLMAFFYAIFVVIRYLYMGIIMPGYNSLMVAILFLGGLNLLGLGIIGEYLARNYIESKHRPLYIVKKIYEEP